MLNQSTEERGESGGEEEEIEVAGRRRLSVAVGEGSRKHEHCSEEAQGVVRRRVLEGMSRAILEDSYSVVF